MSYIRGDPSPQDFYRGVLLALREHRSSFRSEGDRFHSAFGCMLEEAKKTWNAAGLLRESLDPIFGTYGAAESMILDGISAFLLSLDSPHMTTARFTIAPAQAERELSELPFAAVYRALAKTFHEQL